MATVTLATSPDDAAAVEAVEQHHAHLAGALAARVEHLVVAAAAHDAAATETARTGLVGWLQSELMPHAAAEESSMYPAGRDIDGHRVLVDAMTDEHRVLAGLVDRLAVTTDPVRAAAVATTIATLFDVHLHKENDYLLPALAGAAEVSLADLLAGMHELVGDDAHAHHDHHDHHDGHVGHGGHASGEAGSAAKAHGHDHHCDCDEAEAAGPPELDVRQVPHAIRHATVFGALEAVAPGGAMDLVAHHDPVPLLAQVEQARPGEFVVDYLDRGPQAWRLRFTRRTA